MGDENTWPQTSILLLSLAYLLFSPVSAVAEPKAVEEIGALKFGMTPKEVESLAECSSATECLYEVSGKNRYITVFYQPAHGMASPESTTNTDLDTQLVLINIDMGLFTRELYGELHQFLASQYPITQEISDQASRAFQERNLNELALGFADAKVLLKIVRRPFGNLVLQIIYQNEKAALDFRKKWEATAGF